MLSSQFRQWQRCTLLLLVLGVVFYYTPWSIVWAEGELTGCGGTIVAVQNVHYEAAVVELVNQRRAEANLPPMKLVPELTNAARYHAADMTQDNYFSHNSQDREGEQLQEVCSWADRVRGYYTGSRTIGENIAWGYRSPGSVMEGWMNSEGHRNNILGNFEEIGVGYYNSRWVQDFGIRNSALPIIINREAVQTNSPQITIYIHGEGSQLRLRNDGGAWSEWQNFQPEISWTLANVAGERRVDIEVQRGSSTVTGSDIIMLIGGAEQTPTATPVPTQTPIPTPTLTPGSPQGYSEHIYLPLVTR